MSAPSDRGGTTTPAAPRTIKWLPKWVPQGTMTKSTIASIVITGFESLVLLPLLVHVLHVRYWLGFALVQFVANALTFLAYKYWAFDAAKVGRVETQYLKQLVLFAGSYGLNIGIPSFFAYKLRIPPVPAFMLSNAIVYLCWNYPGNRYWVFRKTQPPARSA